MNSEKASQITTTNFTPPHPLKIAVLFLIFNRPDTTKQVFEAIRKAKPPRLYVAADGPRAEKAGEGEKCEQVRRITTQVDWDCEVKTLFREKNLGCRFAVSSAIDWFFENVEEGIILEDDCLPSQSFFWFCEELLKRYRNDTRVMVISGDNFQFGKRRTDYSYYFSRYNHCWGWASWRRAWTFYDSDMSSWKHFRDNGGLASLSSGNHLFERYWENIFNNAHNVDSWAYRWTLTCWQQSGLTALPVVNLIRNIGFIIDSTHTANPESHLSNMNSYELNFPLQHPEQVFRNVRADAYTDKKIFMINWPSEIKNFVKFSLKSFKSTIKLIANVE